MKAWHLLLGLSLVGMSTTYGIQYLYFTETLMQQTFGGQLAYDRIGSLFALSKKWQWVGYALIPIVILIRSVFTSLFLYTGLFLYNLPLRFGHLFQSALLADFVFAVSGLAKLAILVFFKQVETLDDLQFQPLSLIDTMDITAIDRLFHYPLSLINLFEILYIAALILLVRRLLLVHHPNSWNGLGVPIKMVTLSYCSGLLLWTLLVMFATLNLS